MPVRAGDLFVQGDLERASALQDGVEVTVRLISDPELLPYRGGNGFGIFRRDELGGVGVEGEEVERAVRPADEAVDGGGDEIGEGTDGAS